MCAFSSEPPSNPRATVSSHCRGHQPILEADFAPLAGTTASSACSLFRVSLCSVGHSREYSRLPHDDHFARAILPDRPDPYQYFVWPIRWELRLHNSYPLPLDLLLTSSFGARNITSKNKSSQLATERIDYNGDTNASWTLAAGKNPLAAPRRRTHAARLNTILELTNARLLAGSRIEDLPAGIQEVAGKLTYAQGAIRCRDGCQL